MSGLSWVSSCLPVTTDTIRECHQQLEGSPNLHSDQGIDGLLTRLHRRLWLLPGKLSPGLRPWTEVCFSIDQACQFQSPKPISRACYTISRSCQTKLKGSSCSNLGLPCLVFCPLCFCPRDHMSGTVPPKPRDLSLNRPS